MLSAELKKEIDKRAAEEENGPPIATATAAVATGGKKGGGGYDGSMKDAGGAGKAKVLTIDE